MNITRYLILLTIALIPVTSIEAADETEMRFYDVEVVIFKNDKGPRSKEFTLPISSPLMDEEILDLSSPVSIEAAKQKLYEIIPKEELRLTEQVISIVKSSRYSLLAHAGWRQPGLEKEQVMPIWIKGGRLYGNEYISIDNQINLSAMHKADNSDLGDQTELVEPEQTSSEQSSPQPASAEIDSPDSAGLAEPDNADPESPGLYELEGKISIALARFLHTGVELVFRKPRLSMEDPALDEIELSQLGTALQSDTRILNNHSLKERRRMRSNVLHYLDSPEFSMLVLITPYEAPEVVEAVEPALVEEPAESSNSEALQ